MANNLFDQLKEYLSGDNVSQIAGYLGVDATNTRTAVTAALPILLGGLISKTSSPKGAEDIFEMTKGFDDNYLSNLGSVLGGDSKTDELLNSGKKVTDYLFGSNLNAINEHVAKESAMNLSSVAKFIPLIASIIMAFVGKETRSGGISGPAGLTAMFAALLPSLKGLIPAGFLDSIGLWNLFGEKKEKISSTAAKVEEEAKGGLGKILLPLLGIAALLGLIYLFGKGCGEQKTVTTTKKDTVRKVVTADTMTSNIPKEWIALGKFAMYKLISGDSINIPELGIERKLIGFIIDSTKIVDKETWFSFDRILFETDKATLRPESMDQIRSIAAIMKAYPDVELKIGGYTDSTGNAKHNQQLSTERANAVMNAIVGMGIPSARLKAEGYGSQFPIASNSTEEGRAKNRRIDVRVTKK